MVSVHADKSIHLTRGDTAVINLALKMNGEPFILDENDVCVLTVKAIPVTETVLIQKQLVDGKFTIEPSDTSNLKFGIYKYDVQLTTSEGVVSTVITPSNFVIEAEVTF